MDLTGAGGGLMLVLAAGLWLVYLVPNWLRRKEFAATERNAVRLQQTIRILAETSEGPVIAAPGDRAKPRSVARDRSIADGDRAATPRVVSAPLDQRVTRLRRSRAITSLVLLTGVITFVAQLAVSLTAGWAPGGFLVAGVGAVLAVSSIALLRRLASVQPTAVVARQAVHVPDIELPMAPVVREWTPVPMPRPIARPQVAPSTMADPRIAAAAAAESESRTRRGTDRDVAPIPSRFAAMGVVADEAPALDLDAVLARRRA